MGVRPRGICGNAPSSSVYDRISPTPVPQSPNPDPNKYKILDFEEKPHGLALMVQYEGCTNYEGKKVLVYKDVKLKQLLKQGSLDPHFSQNKKYFSPIARFEPTTDGWQVALEFCSRLR